MITLKRILSDAVARRIVELTKLESKASVPLSNVIPKKRELAEVRKLKRFIERCGMTL